MLKIVQLLYNVQVVFPAPNIAQASSRQQYTLSPGPYEYPFKFKVGIPSVNVHTSH